MKAFMFFRLAPFHTPLQHYGSWGINPKEHDASRKYRLTIAYSSLNIFEDLVVDFLILVVKYARLKQPVSIC